MVQVARYWTYLIHLDGSIRVLEGVSPISTEARGRIMDAAWHSAAASSPRRDSKVGKVPACDFLDLESGIWSLESGIWSLYQTMAALLRSKMIDHALLILMGISRQL